MTRINCINVEELTDKHLVAEYRELPRVFNLVRRAIKRGETPKDHYWGEEYLLGEGHVRFFYTRLLWLSWRHVYLVNETVKRGYNPEFYENLRVTFRDIPTEWWGDWEPTTKDRRINRQRIHDRLNGVKG